MTAFVYDAHGATNRFDDPGRRISKHSAAKLRQIDGLRRAALLHSLLILVYGNPKSRFVRGLEN